MSTKYGGEVGSEGYMHFSLQIYLLGCFQVEQEQEIQRRRRRRRKRRKRWLSGLLQGRRKVIQVEASASGRFVIAIGRWRDADAADAPSTKQGKIEILPASVPKSLVVSRWHPPIDAIQPTREGEQLVLDNCWPRCVESANPVAMARVAVVAMSPCGLYECVIMGARSIMLQ